MDSRGAWTQALCTSADCALGEVSNICPAFCPMSGEGRGLSRKIVKQGEGGWKCTLSKVPSSSFWPLDSSSGCLEDEERTFFYSKRDSLSKMEKSLALTFAVSPALFLRKSTTLSYVFRGVKSPFFCIFTLLKVKGFHRLAFFCTKRHYSRRLGRGKNTTKRLRKISKRSTKFYFKSSHANSFESFWECSAEVSCR